jgi:hypothetical protein
MTSHNLKMGDSKMRDTSKISQKRIIGQDACKKSKKVKMSEEVKNDTNV